MVITNSMDRLSNEEEKIIRESAPKLFIKHAVVTTNKFSIAVVNLMLSIKKPVIPIKIFSNKEKALEWFNQS